MVVVGGVVDARLAGRQALLARQLGEVRRHARERIRLERVRVALRLEVRKRRLGRRLRRAVAERTDRGVQHVESRLQSLHVDERREPDRAVAVQLDRPPGGEEVRREVAHRVGGQQTAGILEIEAVDVGTVGERGERAPRNRHACGPG